MNTLILPVESVNGKGSSTNLLYFKVVFWFAFLLSFLLGGALQFFGVLTITETNLLIVSVVAISMLIRMLFSGQVSNGRWYLWAGLASLYILMSGFMNGSGWASTFASLMNVVIPLFILQLVFIAKKLFSPEGILRVLLLISLVQLPIILLQQVGYEYLMSYTAQDIVYLDIGFGTFFLKSDHSIGFFLLCLLLLFLFYPPYQTSRNVRVIYVIWWVVTILFINSKITHAILILVFVSFFIYLIIGRIAFKTFLWSAILLSMLCFALIVYVNYDLLYELYLYIDGRHKQPRWGPVLLAMYEPIKWLGDGPYSYYNPISKEWRIMAGHSYWYSIYYDFGVAGMLLLSSIYILVARYARCSQHNSLPIIYCALILIYGLAVHISIDAPLLLLYFVFLLFNFNGSSMYNSAAKLK